MRPKKAFYAKTPARADIGLNYPARAVQNSS